ncbi:MAG TPA: hypothetical protein VNA20_05450 [Frankiaceae bacterium]|nr:hypothetical protein [Frankiaceae bacterium]
MWKSKDPTTASNDESPPVPRVPGPTAGYPPPVANARGRPANASPASPADGGSVSGASRPIDEIQNDLDMARIALRDWTAREAALAAQVDQARKEREKREDAARQARLNVTGEVVGACVDSGFENEVTPLGKWAMLRDALGQRQNKVSLKRGHAAGLWAYGQAREDEQLAWGAKLAADSDLKAKVSDRDNARDYAPQAEANVNRLQAELFAAMEALRAPASPATATAGAKPRGWLGGWGVSPRSWLGKGPGTAARDSTADRT